MLLDTRPLPIVLAPLAGGPSTPALAAAVADAGGFGFLAAGYLTADQLASDIADLRQRSEAPFGVNLFAPPAAPHDASAVERYAEQLQAEARRWGVELGDPRTDDDYWDRKLELLLDDPVPLVSFTFGCPSAETIGSLRTKGTEVWITVTQPSEATEAVTAGADGLVVQGIEAGGHRGAFVDQPGSGDLGLLVALRLIGTAVDVPLIAAGGVADGASVAAVLAAGATAAAAGTAFLLSPEAGTSPAQRAAISATGPTAITRAFTGRRARGIVNLFLTEHDGEAPSAYPAVHHLTSPVRAAARTAGDASAINLWAGQGHPLATEEPAGTIVARFAAEAREAAERAASRTTGMR